MVERRRDPKKGSILLVLSLLVIASSLWFGGSVYLRGRSAPAEVIEARVSENLAATCAPVLEYEVAGESHRWQSDLASSPCEFSEGDVVDVYYWPGHPDDPYLPSFTRLLLWPGMPVIAGLVLLFLALRAFRGRPLTVNERLRAARWATTREAADGEIVRIRGVVALEGEPEKAPLTGRPCAGYHARVLAPLEADPKRGVPVLIENRGAAMIVRTDGSSVHIDTDTPLRLHVDADARGRTGEDGVFEVLEEFLKSRGIPEGKADTAVNDYAWTEAILEEGSEVMVYGRVRRERSEGYRGRPERVVMTPARDGKVTLAPANHPKLVAPSDSSRA